MNVTVIVHDLTMIKQLRGAGVAFKAEFNYEIFENLSPI